MVTDATSPRGESSDRSESSPPPTDTHARARRRVRRGRPQMESLEQRALLTTTPGVGNNFALVARPVENPGEVVEVPFTIDRTSFSSPGRSMVIGIDVIDHGVSRLNPMVQEVRDETGRSLPKLNAEADRASLVQINLPRAGDRAQFHAQVAGREAGTGSTLTGFYLPGDANGDRKVDPQDARLVRTILGARRGDPTYLFDADADRNGVIDQNDLRLTQLNHGARTGISPVISANLAEGQDRDADRIVASRQVTFAGQASVGAVITFTEENGKFEPVEVTVGRDGTYEAVLTLAEGENQINVTATDPFGQTFNGKLAPVTFDPQAVEREPVPSNPVLPTPQPAPTPGQPSRPVNRPNLPTRPTLGTRPIPPNQVRGERPLAPTPPNRPNVNRSTPGERVRPSLAVTQTQRENPVRPNLPNAR